MMTPTPNQQHITNAFQSYANELKKIEGSLQNLAQRPISTWKKIFVPARKQLRKR